MAFFCMEKWYHSIQDRHRFAYAVTILVEDYLKYSTEIDENDGIYVDEDDEVSLVGLEVTLDESNFHSIINLLDLSGSAPQVNFEAIQELTDKYIFIR